MQHETSYDGSTTMVRFSHASAGTQVDGYNHANQRVFFRNGNTVTYYLYGLGGERLMEFQETCTSGACGSYTETQRWIYFAGRKMFSKTGSTLKAVTPNRLASEAKHFPYGETDGTPPADTKDYFATYRRDPTGLDYAWNRYYSPTMGRFTTADPYSGSEDPGLPDSWNRYSYVGSDPENRTDSTGLFWDPFSLMQGPVVGDWGAGPFSMPDVWGLPWFVPFGLPQPEYPNGVPESTPPLLPEVRGGGGGRPPMLGGRSPMIQSYAPVIQVVIRVGAHVVLRPETRALILLLGQLGTRVFRGTSTFPREEDLINNCTPGRTVVEPATAMRCRGGMSYEQEYICDPPLNGLSVYTMHWILRDGRIIHGPHVRPGPPKGGGGD